MTIALLVYLLCGVTSLICAVLLLRGYSRSRARLLLWTGLCFVCFFINNVVLLVDSQLLPERDLTVLRSLPLVVGVAVLLYGLIWESAA